MTYAFLVIVALWVLCVAIVIADTLVFVANLIGGLL